MTSEKTNRKAENITDLHGLKLEIVEELAEKHAESVGMKVNQLAGKLYRLLDESCSKPEAFRENLLHSIDSIRRSNR